MTSVETKPLNWIKMDVLHVEVSRNPTSHLKTADVVKLLQDAIEHLENPVRDFCIHDSKNTHLKAHIHSIKFCSASKTYRTIKASGRAAESVGGKGYGCNGYKSHSKIEYHIFKLNEEGENAEFVEDDDDDNQSPCSHHWILPSQAYHDLWDSLMFQSDIKTRLLDYIKTAMLYSEKMVNESLISWNKVILLHGPPGTGKTSLCKALAHKATIRLGSRFDYGQLIEINSHSLFSKWFSESGKLVTRMFEKVQELIEDPHSIVFILIDEVESLAQCRSSVLKGNEPSDSIRAVNALLTQIDRIKKYPNVVILTTSNIVGSIDLAFVDRADMKLFIGNPSTDIIYEILTSSINELLRVGIISSENNVFLPPTQKDIEIPDPSYNAAIQLLKISKHAINMSGRTLRKIPFLAHVNFVGQECCNLEYFLSAVERAVKMEKNDLEALDSKYFLRSQKAAETDTPEIIGVFENGAASSKSSSGRSRISRVQQVTGGEASTQSAPTAAGSVRQIGRPRKPLVTASKSTGKNANSRNFQNSSITDPTPPKNKSSKSIEEVSKNSETQNRKKDITVKDGPCPRSKKRGLATPSSAPTIESSRSRLGSSVSESTKSEAVDGIRLRSTKVVPQHPDSDESEEDERAYGTRRRVEVEEPEIISHFRFSKSPRSIRKTRVVTRPCYVDLSKSICDPLTLKVIVHPNTKQSNSKTSQAVANIIPSVKTAASKAAAGAADSRVSLESEKKGKTRRVTEDSIMITSDLPEGMVAAIRPLQQLPTPLILPEVITQSIPPKCTDTGKQSSKPVEPVDKSSSVPSSLSTPLKFDPPDTSSSSIKTFTTTPTPSKPKACKPVPVPKLLPKVEPGESEKEQFNSNNPNPVLKTSTASSGSIKKPNILSKPYTNKTVVAICQPPVDITKMDPESNSNSNASASAPPKIVKPEVFIPNSSSTFKPSLSVPILLPSPSQQQQQQQAIRGVNSNLSKAVVARSRESSNCNSAAVVIVSNTYNNNNVVQLLPSASLATPAEQQPHSNISTAMQPSKSLPQNKKESDNVGSISNSTFRPSSSSYNGPRISVSAGPESAPKNINNSSSNKMVRTNNDNSNGSSLSHPSSAKRPRLSISKDRSPLGMIDFEDNDGIDSKSGCSVSTQKLFSSGPSSMASSIASSPESEIRFTVLSKQASSGNLSAKGKKKFVCDICDLGYLYKRELQTHKQIHAEVNLHTEVNRVSCNQCDKTFAKSDYLKKHMARCKGKPPDPVTQKVQLDGTRLIFKTMPSSAPTNNGKNKNSNAAFSSSRIGNGNGVQKNNYRPNQPKSGLTGKQGGTSTIPQDGEYSPISSYAASPASFTNTNNLGSYDASTRRKPSKFNCSDCDETFSSEKQLQRHTVTHQEERPYSCPLCSRAFKTEASLKFHDRMSHQKPEKYACSICGLMFGSEEEVEEHEGKEHDPKSQQNYNNNNNRLTVSLPVTSVNSNNNLINAIDTFPNDPHTPYSHAATELSSSVSSILSNSSDCDQLGGFYAGGGCGTPYSETNTVESTALTVSSSDTIPFSAHFPNGGSLDCLDFPLGDDYQNCNICGECFLGEYELTQHKQIFHQNSLPGQLPEIPSEVVGCFMNEATSSSVPVPDAETIIEVETTDEFLSFLSAF